MNKTDMSHKPGHRISPILEWVGVIAALAAIAGVVFYIWLTETRKIQLGHLAICETFQGYKTSADALKERIDSARAGGLSWDHAVAADAALRGCKAFLATK
jgi:hypothetical protein